MASREDADDAVAEAYAIAWRRQRDLPRSAELGLVAVGPSFSPMIVRARV